MVGLLLLFRQLSKIHFSLLWDGRGMGATSVPVTGVHLWYCAVGIFWSYVQFHIASSYLLAQENAGTQKKSSATGISYNFAAIYLSTIVPVSLFSTFFAAFFASLDGVVRENLAAQFACEVQFPEA